MDQDAFRTLLTAPATGRASASTSRTPAVASRPNKPKTVPASTTVGSFNVFKPRKVTKPPTQPSNRPGSGEVQPADSDDADNDKDAPKVKGLDFTLLEKERAKLRGQTDAMEDDMLEAAFNAAANGEDELIIEPASTEAPKKRTRADLLNELKKKRGDVPIADAAIPKSKFKPIGAPSEKEEKRKKKKRKVVPEETASAKTQMDKVGPEALTSPSEVPAKVLSAAPEPTAPPAPTSPPPAPAPKAPEPDDDDGDVDIFADVGEYEGVDLGSDEEEADDKEDGEVPVTTKPDRPKASNWFDEPDMEEDDDGDMAMEPQTTSTAGPSAPSRSVSLPDPEEDDQPMRLAPLETSSIRDIKGFLEMDKELEKAEKRKARKEKRKKEQA